jgi:hypothetical protein
MKKLLIVLALLGCHHKAKGTAAAHAPPSDPSLAQYQKDLKPLVQLESDALSAVIQQTGAGYKDEASMLAALDNAIPRYKQFVDGLAAIHPQGDALSALHVRFQKAAGDELALLGRLEGAIQRGDGTAILLANQDQKKLRTEMDAIVADFQALPLRAGAP